MPLLNSSHPWIAAASNFTTWVMVAAAFNLVNMVPLNGGQPLYNRHLIKSHINLLILVYIKPLNSEHPSTLCKLIAK